MRITRNAPPLSFAIAVLVIVVAIIGLSSSGSAGAAAGTPTKAQAKPQGVSPEAILPGDSAIATAFGNQENTQIAAGGSGYLVVWEDSRTNYINIIDGFATDGGEESGQQLRDIYAARLDADGNLIDSNPIIIHQASWSQTVPQVAWNGQNWLVTWESQRAVNYSSTRDILAARISPDGQVLDNPPIVVDNIPTIDERWPTVASDGNNWVVIWMDEGNYFELDAVRISPTGAVLDPGGVALHTPQFPYPPYNPSLAFSGGEYMVVYSANGSLRGFRFSPTLELIGTEITIGNGNFPEIFGNGTDFFVAWGPGGVYGARVSQDGTVQDPGGINLTGPNGAYAYPDVSWDGTNWLVSWVSYQNKTVLSRVTPSGQSLDPNGIIVSTTAYQNSAVAGRPGGGAQMAWTDIGIAGLGSYDIFGATVSGAGVPGTPQPISKGAPRQLWPDLAPNGTSYLLVFQSAVAGDTRIKGQRLNADGTPIDSEPFLIAGGSKTFIKPRVAWNGSVYLVVWEDTSVSRGFGPGAIFGKRVALDGTVLDATPFEIMGGNSPDVAALGSTFLVADTFEPTNHFRPVQAVRVDGNGSLVGSPAYVGSSYAVDLNVEPLGNRWLIVWQDHPTHDNPRSNISAVFVNADGTAATEFILADPGLDPALSPDIAIGNNQALVTYYAGIGADVSQGDLYGTRMLPDGTLLDGNPGIQITNANLAQFVPSAVWTGSEYLVVYEDFRNVPYLDKPISDIYATRVGSDGTVQDPNGFAIANLYIPEVNPVVESLPAAGTYVLGFANFKFAAPYSHYRIDVRHGQAGQPPVPEPSATPTNTPSPTPPSCISDNYVFTTETSATIVPGTVDIGNHCDECATEITLPFPFTLYDRTFNTVEATANGTLNFVTSDRTGGGNFCLPYSFLDYAIVPHWHDMMTVGEDGGIFTSVSGTAPNRIFNIEWRACSFGGWLCGSETYNFEARLYEGTSKFEFIYGQVDGNGRYTTIGVQKGAGQRYTEYSCSMSNQSTGLESGLKITFVMNSCGSPSPVPTFPTSTPVPTNTPGGPTSTNTTVPPTGTSVPPTNTPGGPTATNTAVVPTSTPGGPTSTTVPPTNTPVVEPSATTVACQIQFTDVPAGSTFYEFVQCLACRQVLGGYPDNTFRPNDGVTRGQLSKIVSNAAGWNDPVSGQTFTDVAPGSTFYEYVERMASRGIIGGYPDGTFRPSDPATRGQISKIVARAYGYEDPMSFQTFEDVAPSSTFFLWIENLAVRGIMNGYVCGGAGEPCGQDSKSYFRPSNNATRGQVAKIVSNTFFPNCQP